MTFLSFLMKIGKNSFPLPWQEISSTRSISLEIWAGNKVKIMMSKNNNHNNNKKNAKDFGFVSFKET